MSVHVSVVDILNTDTLDAKLLYSYYYLLSREIRVNEGALIQQNNTEIISFLGCIQPDSTLNHSFLAELGSA